MSFRSLLAAQDGKLEELKCYKDRGGRIHSMHYRYAADYGQLEVLKWLSEYGVNHDEAAYRAAEGGHLEALKWIMANGGPWTTDAADRAATGGHLETLKWIRANGGPWTYDAADMAAAGGHLETLKWIRANGGEWTCYAADRAARNHHYEVMIWLKNNGAPINKYAPKLLHPRGRQEILDYCTRIGYGWGDMGQVHVELSSLDQLECSMDLIGIISEYVNKSP